jgi:hypothetical protein
MEIPPFCIDGFIIAGKTEKVHGFFKENPVDVMVTTP